MYGYEWTEQNGIYKLIPNAKIIKEIRPVFKEELDYFGMNQFWQYPDTKNPLLWAEGIRRYVLNGKVVATASGGGLYTKPKITIKKENLTLRPINVNALWKENERLMLGLENMAIELIRDIHDKYRRRQMNFVVAFSGGKDSLLLLDLVAKALRPDEFFVIFANTDMELDATITAVERAQKFWPRLNFHEARSHFRAEQSWDFFGPPARLLRWCCSVHKSVPTILKLREITGNYDAKAVVFDGVRKAESASRATYDVIGKGVKNINQVNASPILDWGTAEVYLHLLHHGLLFNDLYREGFNRVGCSICPLSSMWCDHLTYGMHRKEIKPLLNKVKQYVEKVKPAKNLPKYIENGGWRARIGGRGLSEGGNRVIEVINDDKITFKFMQKTNGWREVSKILGKVVGKTGGSYTQFIDGKTYTFTMTDNSVTYQPFSQMDRFVVSKLRGVANKVAYCVGCKSCVVQCPVGAFEITDKWKIFIRESDCIHCGNCINFTAKGCLVAKSLSTTEGRYMDLKGLSPYETFGFRREWLEHFFEYEMECFTQGQLGNRQYNSLKIWLRQAELITTTKRNGQSGTTTPLFEQLRPLGAGNPLVWAIIWTNLAYNSVIARWYMHFTEINKVYDLPELIFMLGDDYSATTRRNAVQALLETFRRSPVGPVLKQGIPIPDGRSFRYSKQGWSAPDAVAVLYSLYKFAEETGHYTFTISGLKKLHSSPNAKGVSPALIFGMDLKKFRSIVQEVAIFHPDYIRVAFVQDLDNIILRPEKAAIDVLELTSEVYKGEV